MGRLRIRMALALGLVLAVSSGMGAQSVGSDAVRVTQRWDYRQRIDGRYAGVVYGYTLGRWTPLAPGPAGQPRFRAWYWVSPEGGQNPAQGLVPMEKEIQGEFMIPLGLLGTERISLLPGHQGPVPLRYAWPSPLPETVAPGAYWRAPAVFWLDPQGLGRWTRFDVFSEYRVKGLGTYGGQEVIEVFAQFALRYRAGSDPQGDPDLVQVEGGREATIYYSVATGNPVFARELVKNEVWRYRSGRTVQNDGFVLTFWEGALQQWLPGGINRAVALADQLRAPVNSDPGGPAVAGRVDEGSTGPAATESGPGTAVASLDRQATEPPTVGPPTTAERAEELRRAVADAAVEEVAVQHDERGINLRLDSLRFVADQATLLPGEDRRLDGIARALKTLPESALFLVIGHTARIGTEESQQTLSEQRAVAIARALAARGLAPGRLLTSGRGGTEPVAPNDTETGRAQNRRVEIIIL